MLRFLLKSWECLPGSSSGWPWTLIFVSLVFWEQKLCLSFYPFGSNFLLNFSKPTSTHLRMWQIPWRQKLNQILSSLLWDYLFPGILNPQILAVFTALNSNFSLPIQSSWNKLWTTAFCLASSRGWQILQGFKKAGVKYGIQHNVFFLYSFDLPNLFRLPWLIPNAFEGIYLFIFVF